MCQGEKNCAFLGSLSNPKHFLVRRKIKGFRRSQYFLSKIRRWRVIFRMRWIVMMWKIMQVVLSLWKLRRCWFSWTFFIVMSRNIELLRWKILLSIRYFLPKDEKIVFRLIFFHSTYFVFNAEWVSTHDCMDGSDRILENEVSHFLTCKHEPFHLNKE